MTIQHKLSKASLEAVRQPIESASGMPNAAYTDFELFEFERDHVFAPTWAGLEFTSSLPHNSYAKPVDFMGLPLLLVRNTQGEIKVFHNVCSHRGRILVDEEGPVRNLIRCPYHSWSYDTDGALKSTPHIGGFGENTAPGFSCEGNGLKEVRSAQWMGIMFINLSGTAETFTDFIAPLNQRWEAFTGAGVMEKLHVASTYSNAELAITANWKFALENYCEAYHLPWVHPNLNSYSPLNKHENLEINEYMTGQVTLSYTLAEASGHTLPKFPAWPSDKHSYGEYISLYPNLLLGMQVDHAFAVILQPQSPSVTLEKLQIAYVNQESTQESMQACREAVMASWQLVLEEDAVAVEGMQRGRSSPGFTGGVFSPVLDSPSHAFHKWVADNYAKALS